MLFLTKSIATWWT